MSYYDFLGLIKIWGDKKYPVKIWVYPVKIWVHKTPEILKGGKSTRITKTKSRAQIKPTKDFKTVPYRSEKQIQREN